jgi:hypothetical protein
MTFKIDFEHDYQHKLMRQSFGEPVVLSTPADVQVWRNAWMGALSSWHSPYKVVVDCTKLTVGPAPEVKKALDLMLKFFHGFFLRKAVGFGLDAAKGHAFLPFPVLAGEDEAYVDVGLRQPKTREPTDFRSTIQFQNHFKQHTVELNFSQPVVINDVEQVKTLKSKLMNNLMQWHSKWSLLVDCANLEVEAALKEELGKALSSMHGFFMKTVIGYSPKGPKASYPFDVYRARHRAAALLEGEGNFSGDEADCKSKKTPSP